MLRRLAIWAVLLAAIASAPAEALLHKCPVLCSNQFSWVLRGAAVDLNFATGQYYAGGATTPGAQLSIARSTSGYAQNASTGIWTLFGNNTFRIGPGNGLLIEEARTNDAFWARDMTQAGSWTAVGMGTALNAVGIDGSANSATTLTATGTASSCTASCTILQAITLGSQADTYSVWLKRVTGSGAVNITINNLVGTTACTLTTTAFTRCSVTATLANPVIGIQMTVLNDVIVADFNQMEPGGFATSPILTTGATASRSADNVTPAAGSTLALSSPFAFGATQGWAYISVGALPFNPGAFGTIWATRNSSTNIIFQPSDNTHIKMVNDGNTTLSATLGAGSMTTRQTNAALTFNGTSRSIVANGGTIATDTSQAWTQAVAAKIGNYSNNQYMNGYLVRIAVGNTAISLTGFTQ